MSSSSDFVGISVDGCSAFAVTPGGSHDARSIAVVTWVGELRLVVGARRLVARLRADRS
jgi:hypothetical protein